jgi:hypothetical protein
MQQRGSLSSYLERITLLISSRPQFSQDRYRALMIHRSKTSGTHTLYSPRSVNSQWMLQPNLY